MKHSVFNSLILACLILLSLAACGSKDSAATAVEGYLEALVAKDGTKLTNLSCADWEASAQVDLDSLVSVETSLKDLQCQDSETDGDYTLVTCTGSIVANYNGELQELDLSARTYQAVQEGGEWRMCGYR